MRNTCLEREISSSGSQQASNPQMREVPGIWPPFRIQFRQSGAPGFPGRGHRPRTRRAPGQGAAQGPWEEGMRGIACLALNSPQRLARVPCRTRTESTQKLSPCSHLRMRHAPGRSSSRISRRRAGTPRATTGLASKWRAGSSTRTSAALGLRLRVQQLRQSPCIFRSCSA